MLSEAEQGGYGHIVSWNDDGSLFLIHNKDLFVAEIMPKFFTQTQFRSFQKQLNLYGFERLATCSKSSMGIYQHPAFQRGKKNLCKTIARPSAAKEAKMLKAELLKEESKQEVVEQIEEQSQHPMVLAMPVLLYNSSVSSSESLVACSVTPTKHHQAQQTESGVFFPCITRHVSDTESDDDEDCSTSLGTSSTSSKSQMDEPAWASLPLSVEEEPVRSVSIFDHDDDISLDPASWDEVDSFPHQQQEDDRCADFDVIIPNSITSDGSTSDALDGDYQEFCNLLLSE